MISSLSRKLAKGILGHEGWLPLDVRCPKLFLTSKVSECIQVEK